MSQVLVRGLEKGTVARLKRQARQNRRSLEAELRAILEAAAKHTPAEFGRLAASLRRGLKGRTFSDSVELLRQDRDR